MYECSQECPECGGKIKWDFACHTYPQTSFVCSNKESQNHEVKWNDGNPWCLSCDVESISKVTWMACMPCDSATRYVCVAHDNNRCFSDCGEYNEHEGCGWTWTWGLNPGNPRAADNETRNPNWDG